MRPIVTAMTVMALVATGCAMAGLDNQWPPPNDGANAEAGETMLVRNAFLLSGTDAASPTPQQALFAVLINQGGQPARLEQVTVDGGGSVQLAGPITLPPNQPVGTNSRPIGTVTGTRGWLVPMTFTFSGGESARMVVPVMPRAAEYAQLPTVPAQAPTPTTPATAPPSPGVSPFLTESPRSTGAPGRTEWPEAESPTPSPAG
ncbi:hypothetical protein [Nonomuraea maritima]|uniref:hypothetical protein n=1 Tax=Nonomuraea maritima TaxID=683260 RepID=UPI00371072F9